MEESKLYGYGIIVSGSPRRPTLSTPCELIRLDYFTGIKKALGNDEMEKLFLPLCMPHLNNAASIKSKFEETLKEVAVILPKCNPNKTPLEEMIIKTIPNLMSATVVEFSKGTQHTRDNSLNGYFALHRLFLWALETYPSLANDVDDRIEDFIIRHKCRTKDIYQDIGGWLMLLAGSCDYRWKDAADEYLTETMRRQVIHYVKEDPKLGMSHTGVDYRLEHTLKMTVTSRKLVAIQVMLLDIAIPQRESRKGLIKRYDDNLGYPTPEMVKQVKATMDRINNMTTFEDWYKVLGLETPTNWELYLKLDKAVKFAVYNDSYNISHWKTGGGWREVLKEYRPWKQGNTTDDAEGDGTKDKGKAPLTGPGLIKGTGRGKKVGSKGQKSLKVVKSEGRGRGKGAITKRSSKLAAGRGMKGTRTKSKAKGESNDQEKMDVVGLKCGGKKGTTTTAAKGKKGTANEVKPAGRGRGKRTADEAFGAKVGRGGKKKK